MDSSSKKSADDAKSMNDLFELVEKLTIQLNEKDKELAIEKQEKQKLSANLDLAMSRANQADELKDGLANAHQIIQLLWKSFPSPGPALSYYIKTQSGSQDGQFRFLYAETDLYLCAYAGDQDRSEFKFIKNSDGSISINLMLPSQERYLQTNARSPTLEFSGNKGKAAKFVLFFHQQNQHAAISVDISTLDGYFFCLDNDGYVEANSRTPPSDKFLIVPADEDD